MLICAGNTSPLFPHYDCLDSSMFLLTGRGILEGKICYVDLFDHKGPVFFWLEAVGYALGGRTGVWIWQSILAVADVLLIEKIAAELKAKSLLPTIAFASVFFYCFMHGNLTEEFSMPLILLAVLLEIRFLNSESKTHRPLYALVYGIIIGTLAFIRVNNAITICILVLCIGVVLIKEKQWKNIILNLIAGTFGIALVTVPVCVYYYANNALDDMLYATFLHNLIYAKENTHSAIFSKHLINFIFMYAPGAFAVAIFGKRISENSRLYVSLLIATIVTYAMLLYSNIYAHYFMLGLPLFAIAVACAFPDFSFRNISSLMRPKKLKGLSLMIVIVAFSLLSVYSAAAPFYKTYTSGSSNEQYRQISESMKQVPEQERNSVIGFGVLADFYVHADITPCYKYYTLQRWMTNDERDVYGEFMEYAAHEHPLWIVINEDETDSGIGEVLEAYDLIVSDDYYEYYRYRG